MVQQQHRVSWGGWGCPNHYVDTPNLSWGWISLRLRLGCAKSWTKVSGHIHDISKMDCLLTVPKWSRCPNFYCGQWSRSHSKCASSSCWEFGVGGAPNSILHHFKVHGRSRVLMLMLDQHHPELVHRLQLDSSHGTSSPQGDAPSEVFAHGSKPG